jgi:two-component system, OmpR family, sensor histidine kinase TctE
MPAPGSLKQLLRFWLVGPLLALILLSAIPAYFIAVNAANDIYDGELLDPAIAISKYVRQDAGQIEVALPPVALDALRIDHGSRIFFEVTGPEGQTILGSAAIPVPPHPIPPSTYAMYSSQVAKLRVRVAAISVPQQDGPVLVKVAETMAKRDRFVIDILVGALAAAVAVAAAAAALFWFGIRRSLAPLDRLRDEIEHRSPADLAPVASSATPLEVKPLVTAINQLLSRLQEALGTQQRFIANAAHQLRTPLAGLKMHVALARREVQTGEARALIDMIASETERASHLANQLLTLARAEPSSSLQGARQPVNLHDVASRAVQGWVPRALARGIDLGFELQDAWSLGDPLLLRELLANLVDNAINYTPSGGNVTVRTRVDGGAAVLEVEDCGPGIPESEHERVFERFYRLPGTGGEGCGLGLAIVREIAERHGARVQLATPVSGTGTIARVSFPGLLRSTS